MKTPATSTLATTLDAGASLIAAAQGLFTASALVLLALGTLHLVFTFHGTRFHPRDETLLARLKTVSPRISSATTMWRSGLGFHASHSAGAMLFGLVFAYLAHEPSQLLLRSPFLLALGAVFLAAWVVLAWRCWFRVPLIGVALAAGCYALALACLWGAGVHG